MAVCPKCNKQQPDGLNYCINCGASLGTVPSKKGVPAKGLLLGGCGCITLIAIIIGIIIVLVFVMGSMQRRGPGATPQPPIVQPQPTVPGQPTIPPQPVEQPVIPQQPTVPTQPVVQPSVPVTPSGYPELKEGELMIRFAKGLAEDGMTINPTTEFSTSDPQIVQVIRWGPNTVTTGAFVMWGWYYNNNIVWSNYYTVQEGYTGVYDKVDRPASGFPVGEYTVLVAVNGTPVISHTFTVR